MTERNSLRQVPVFHVHGLNVIKRSAGIILSAGRFLHLMGGCICGKNELVSFREAHGRTLLRQYFCFRQKRTALVSLKAQDIFAEKINNCGKTSCTLIRMAGTKHEIFNAQDDILETYWGHVFGFFERIKN